MDSDSTKTISRQNGKYLEITFLKSSLMGWRRLLEPECPVKGVRKTYMTLFDHFFSLSLKTLVLIWILIRILNTTCDPSRPFWKILPQVHIRFAAEIPAVWEHWNLSAAAAVQRGQLDPEHHSCSTLGGRGQEEKRKTGIFSTASSCPRGGGTACRLSPQLSNGPRTFPEKDDIGNRMKNTTNSKCK